MEKQLPLHLRAGSPTKVQRYFQALKEGKLMGTKCSVCKVLYCPPRADCPTCAGSDLEWVELTGRGNLRTYTVVEVAPLSFSTYAPYAVGIVQLEEGPKVMAQLVDLPPGAKEGLQVQAVFSTGIGGLPILKFRPK